MSPILVRPVREQLEHDRVIRLLQAKYKRKFDVGINPGDQQLTPAGTGPGAVYPDLVLHTSQRGRRLAGVVEVETAESVNHLEAMSEWVSYGRIRADFHLYVPTSSIDPARRMCLDMGVGVSELWAYSALGEQIRFTLVQRFAASGRGRAAAKVPAARKAAAKKKTAKKTAKKKGAAKTTVKKAAAAKKAAATKKGAAKKKKTAAARKK